MVDSWITNRVKSAKSSAVAASAPGFLNASNHLHHLERDFVGNGNREIVLRDLPFAVDFAQHSTAAAEAILFIVKNLIEPRDVAADADVTHVVLQGVRPTFATLETLERVCSEIVDGPPFGRIGSKENGVRRKE